MSPIRPENRDRYPAEWRHLWYDREHHAKTRAATIAAARSAAGLEPML